jgi:hypothetical protein
LSGVLIYRFIIRVIGFTIPPPFISKNKCVRRGQ